ncbi:MAG: ABC transporter ATP-binding protein [Planctomycetes bacterium]|nr:ABC transporter ATP-binding protein [Planctomycetota bacterium]
MPEPFLDVRDVTRTFDTPAGPLVVLAGVSFALGRGESVAVTGPSGSGKSTLLNIVGTLDAPTSGSVLLDGRSVHGLGDKEASQLRNARIGFVFQDHHLFPQCTALENILMPLMARAAPPVDAAARAEKLLADVGLADKAASFPAELSGGERQRVAVARALVNSPDLLLCDEPTGNLDIETGKAVARLFLEFRDSRNVSVIVVTHNSAIASMFGLRHTLAGGRLHE